MMMRSTEQPQESAPMTSIPIDNEDASASLSMADVNLLEKGQGGSTRSLQDATVFDMTENSEHLPTVEEVRASGMDGLSTTRRCSRRRLCLCVCIPFGLLVLALVLAIIVGVSIEAGEEYQAEIDAQNDASSDNSAPYLQPRPTDASPPVAAPVPAPVAEKRATLNEIVSWVKTKGISSEAALSTSGTPQQRAVAWLATQDAAALPLPTHNDGSDEEKKYAYMYMVRYVLAVVYFGMNGENWPSQMNFLSPSTVCLWNGMSQAAYGGFQLGGVLCDAESELPIVLDLEYNNLDGEIPTEIGHLTTLNGIDMIHNANIAGEIPTELCNLVHLDHLLLKGNQISGKLPACMQKWTKMQELNLLDNSMTGLLPTEVCDMTAMTQLVLDKNFFDGPIPECITKWSHLETLSLSDNQLTGDLPTQLTQLKKLKKLYIDGNFFGGNPISTINQLHNLELLYIENNQFVGTLDENFVKSLKNITSLDISSNNFTTTLYGIPSHLFAMPQLAIMDFSNNHLRGAIPTAIANNSALRFLSVHENHMSGGIPPEVANLQGLLHLDLSNNDFHGPLRSQLFEMKSLFNLFLANNKGLHSGFIPSELAQMTQLAELSLKNTNRTGALPDLVGFTNLFLLDLDNNQLTGTVPANYGTLPRLRHLLLNRNTGISGSLPAFNGTGNLGTVLLDGTGVTGDFNGICNLPTFTGEIELATGTIMVASCGGSDTAITCDCCHCCDVGANPFCSDPLVVSLDWTWEHGWTRTERDFQLNFTVLEKPELASGNGRRS